MENLTIKLEFFGEISIYYGLLIQVVSAFFLAILIGYDREKKMKAAGIKTNLLICIGATLYTSISLLNIQQFGASTSDPNRLIAQVVSGIGFLGAGVIFRGRAGVTGLTTAATIWMVAAIGVTIGSGYPFIAAIFTMTTLVILKLLNPIYQFIERAEGKHEYRVEILSRGSISNIVKMILDKEFEEDFIFREEVSDVDENLTMLVFNGKFTPRRISSLEEHLRSLIQVVKVKYVEKYLDTF